MRTFINFYVHNPHRTPNDTINLEHLLVALDIALSCDTIEDACAYCMKYYYDVNSCDDTWEIKDLVSHLGFLQYKEEASWKNQLVLTAFHVVNDLQKDREYQLEST